ncbi:MarR family winged helix-turn-helix transcriptional regulator [Streptomyces sp. NBC_01460]|uniref:MarR family winged helix-turn-helix transcriptional regulator n=1 Tax=Streptomyces sp. NBC_01460 TaxID=2903875 RepID=UPI002E3749C7|nr:MarR family winged helix-turn-helix transcriptional regulator [Streptomyces sp. NBC_01460]
MSETNARPTGPGGPTGSDGSVRPTAPARPSEPTEATEATEATENGDRLSRTAIGVFRLNGRFLSVAEELAGPAGLTAARWQVLGAVLGEPLPVSGIARSMGITRQSVQRIADLLVEQGLGEYVANPAHRRAKLLRPTADGRTAVNRITPAHAEFAARLAGELGEEQFALTVQVLERLSAAMDTLTSAAGPPRASSGGSGRG